MNRSLWLYLCSGLVSLSLFTGTAANSNAQCACGGGDGSMIYEPGALGLEASPEELLREVDNPAEIINLLVVVDDKALITINDEPTYTKGNARPYIVRGLKPGKKYAFEIKALVKSPNGAEYGAKEKVELTAGDSKQVVLHVRRQKRTPPPAPVAPVAPVAPAAAK